MNKLILLLSILTLSLAAHAEQVTIGTGTIPSRFPLGSYFNYERSAALYTAAEIGAQGISISEIGWFATIDTGTVVPTRIYLKTTTASTLTDGTWANMISGATLLYDKTKAGTVANVWNMFTLSSPFNVRPGKNLVILVERNYGGSWHGPLQGGGILSSLGTQVTWWSDGSPPTGNADSFDQPIRPNLKLSYTVDPDELDIGAGTDTQRFPVGNFYGYERSAALYTATEIGARNISISDVAWHASITTTAVVPIKIYLKTTTVSTLPSGTWANMTYGATLLYDGIRDRLGAYAWNIFTLSSPFDLAQGDNLLILVESNYGGSGGGTSAGGAFRSSTKPNTHLTWTADYNPPNGENNDIPSLRPDIKLFYYTNNVLTPTQLPFTEGWASGVLDTNLWTKESGNWRTSPDAGSPAPCASFSWNPQLNNYSSALTSHDFDAKGMNRVQFSFDLFFANSSTDEENVMTWQIWNGSAWITLGSYSSLSNDLPWTHYSYDVSTHASNRIFKIRFVASGVTTYYINHWDIDNIYLGQPVTSFIPVTNFVISRIGSNLGLSWSPVAGAEWYVIYGSSNLNEAFIPLATISSDRVSAVIGTGSTGKYFFKMTAGTGPSPSATKLSNSPDKP